MSGSSSNHKYGTPNLEKSVLDAVLRFEDTVGDWYEKTDRQLVGFSVRLPEFEGDEFFIVVRVAHDEKRFAGFITADTLAEVLLQLSKGMKYNRIKLRSDRYADRND